MAWKDLFWEKNMHKSNGKCPCVSQESKYFSVAEKKNIPNSKELLRKI